MPMVTDLMGRHAAASQRGPAGWDLAGIVAVTVIAATGMRSWAAAAMAGQCRRGPCWPVGPSGGSASLRWGA
ncbi:MAG: hypothetical protein ABSB01_09330 [Streptosporangiaceae bacterium]